ncbi:MAG: OsmC family protein [Betaproteobacteria bacterium]|nr:OsmC family protein [Betaproteobacteria bacterium]
MVTRTADAEWRGSLKDGDGSVRLGSGAFEGRYSFGSRFEQATGTNPEELLGAAHAACFSMALSLVLGGAGLTPQRVSTTAAVDIRPDPGGGFSISGIHLTTEAEVPGADAKTFADCAQAAKSGCPLSKALAAVEITLDARLVESGKS